MKTCEEQGMTLRQMSEAFNKQFNAYTTSNTMQRACTRYKLFSERRGLSMEAGKRNPFTQRKPIGAEMWSAGKLYVKVSEDVVPSGKANCNEDGNWREKKRVMYEQYYGMIPDGYLVIQLNMDKADFRKENLYAVPRGIGMMMGANKWYSENAEITLTGIKYCELYLALTASS